MPKKLIEVALPLEAINAESAREKSIRHGHPSTLHMWWARRPLATTRAVIWASLVDDPSAHPELFSTEEAQQKERSRLFGILTDLVKWENSNNEDVLNKAKAEIRKSTGGNPPELLDPFAGGGAIPLEAQRLGLKAHAHDLNPVAVTINRAMIEIPARFASIAPVNPEARANSLERDAWPNATGLAEDVRYYGEKLKEAAWKEIGDLYPKVKVPEEMGGGEATVIAWIWARTVKCPNPACGCEMPLVRSFELSKKKGKAAYTEPVIENGKITYTVKQGKGAREGTVNRQGAVCACCGAPVPFSYIREEGKAGRMHEDLMAVVAEGAHGRLYLSPDSAQINAAKVSKPSNYPEGELAYYPGHLNTKIYGLTEFHQLFTNRQLTALTTFCDCLSDITEKAEQDAIAAGLAADGKPLAEGGSGAKAYNEAVRVYLTFNIDKVIDRNCAICSWINTSDDIRPVFARQAIPMTWDYAEANPFSNSVGCWSHMTEWISDVIKELVINRPAKVFQSNAQSDCGLRNVMVSTDPPYYDNIGYADLSDFYYIWLRKNLQSIYPKEFSTMLVPKAEELVATPYRFDGSKEKAKNFFEDGMFQTCRQLAKYTNPEIPVTIYYAYKQSETNESDKTSSSGWETMLSAIIRSGFAITGTWPVRTERSARPISSGANALASSIVLVCRLRPEDAPVCTKRQFVSQLRKDLKTALMNLKNANIAPVDLAQSAIGPGIGAFSRYKQVLEADGSPMTVRSALYIINDEIGTYFNEQDSGLDRESRFCIDLYTQAAFNEIPFGDADILARAKNTSVDKMAQDGVLQSGKGHVRLLAREELSEHTNDFQPLWLSAQQLTHAMTQGGTEAAAKIVLQMSATDAEKAKDLAYRLFTIADKKNRTQEAYEYNNLVAAWQDIVNRAAELKKTTAVEQLKFD